MADSTTTGHSDLEREVALLTWHLKAARLTQREQAVEHNRLRFQSPRRGAEERIEDLTVEFSKW